LREAILDKKIIERKKVMKISELIELFTSIGVALTGLGSALNGVAKVIKVTKKEPQKTAKPRKFK